jgi:hypothetical protein
MISAIEGVQELQEFGSSEWAGCPDQTALFPGPLSSCTPVLLHS